MGREIGRRFGRKGTWAYLWLIPVDIWQQTIKFCKAIILQLKKQSDNKNKLFIYINDYIYKVLVRRIPWTEEPGGLYSPWGHKESNMTKWLTHTYRVALKSNCLNLNFNSNFTDSAIPRNLIMCLCTCFSSFFTTIFVEI